MLTTYWRRTAALGALLLLTVGFVAVAPGGAQTTTTKVVSNSVTSTTAEPKGWILVDADSGVILGGRNIHDAYYPASTTKLMTALTVAERLPGAADVTVSELAAKQPANKLAMAPGSTWKVHDLLYSLLLVSANDVAYALAERVGGDLAGFASLMTETGKRIGLQDSTFNDPAGLDDPKEAFNGGTKMSAFDLATAARAVLADPYLAPIVGTRTYEFTGPDGPHSLANHNLKFIDGYDGANGMKTGFTQQAGRTLVASATRDGRTMIAVILDTYDATGWAMRLLDRGFDQPVDAPGLEESLPAVNVRSAEANASVLASLPLVLGRPAATVDAVTPVPTTAVAPATETDSATPEGAAVVDSEPTVATADTAADATAASSSGSSRLLFFVVVVMLILATLVALRVRAVSRRRRRRAIRLRQFHDARRRGSLTVLDDDQWSQPNHVRTVQSRR